MADDTQFILWFRDLTIDDVPRVGGKNAALGEMVAELMPLGVNVPDGFAVTAAAYNYFLDESGVRDEINQLLRELDVHDVADLQDKGAQIRKLITDAEFPDDMRQAIVDAYHQLEEEYTQDVDVAVRSSATAEDLPDASFAGQQETFLNVVGPEAVLEASKNAIASLFTDRAISYRNDKGFSHEDIALSVGVQKMVRSDLAASGVMFSIDTETGFDNVVIINSSYGLGDMIVQGRVVPDEFTVFKPTLKKDHNSIIGREVGKKDTKMIYAEGGSEVVDVSEEDQEQFSLTDDEVLQLAEWAVQIEEHFSKHHGHYQPMDIEWAKDGETGTLFIVQARPETVHATRDKDVYKEHRLNEEGNELADGIAVGARIADGPVRVIQDVEGIGDFQKGEVLVTDVTDPDWEPIMKIAAAIVTNKGGRTSHAAIVSRELGIPAIVGAGDATERLEDGQEVTVDCSSGKRGIVYEGRLDYEEIEHRLDNIPETDTKVMVNIGSPHAAFKNHFLPVSGVGLGRLEFIITSHIKIHPNALINFDELAEREDAQETVQEITALTRGYDDKKAYYLDELAEGIGKIGAAFWPDEVIIRFSDFKTNEYRTLIGGEFYEPEEANPMLGWRGASRYYHDSFREAFGLECQAVKRVREEMGLTNVVVMVPFCRTIEEAQKVFSVMRENGLDPKQDDALKVYVMCEIPSNVVLADQFLEYFDGMSIGSNDLTQLTLGMDRDSGIVNSVGDERDEAVKEMVATVIDACREEEKYVGICGQAPSDFPEFARFVVDHGIASVSLNPDVVIKTLPVIAEAEQQRS